MYHIVLKNICYVPTSGNNLLSTIHLDRQGATVVNGHRHLLMYNSDKHLIIQGTLRHLYKLKVKQIPSETVNVTTQKHLASCTEWHKCFGHISISGLQKLHSKSLVKNFTLKGSTEIADCNACAEAKLTCNPFSSEHAIKATAPGEQTHTDVWGPTHETSCRNYTVTHHNSIIEHLHNRYYVTASRPKV